MPGPGNTPPKIRAARPPSPATRQFETIQERLAGEPLIDYVQPFGGGYFFTLPGVTHGADRYGRTMLA